MSHKKRKISDLTMEDTSRLLIALTAFQENLDEADEDLPPELLPALKKLAAKLQVAPHISFSRVDGPIFNELGITLKPMSLLKEKCAEAEALGLVEAPGSWLTIDATKELIRLIRSHVSRVNEAGSRILINTFLLRLAAVMSHAEAEVNIIPEFPLTKTTLHGYSFSGVVDFLLTRAHSKYNDLLLETPFTTLVPHNKCVTQYANIFEAKRDNVKLGLSQAIVAAASYCKQHGLAVMRGCVTSGEQWAFFVYASDRAVVAVAPEIGIGDDLARLPLVLGLLRDWVENAKVYDQNFFDVMA